VPRDAGDFSLIDRRVVEVLNTMHERDRFLRGLRAWVGFKQIGVPYARTRAYVWADNQQSVQKHSRGRVREFSSFSYVPLEMIFISRSIRYFGFGRSYRLLRYDVFRWPKPPSGFVTLLVAVLFLGGVQLTCLSMLVINLGRIFRRSKGTSRVHSSNQSSTTRASRALSSPNRTRRSGGTDGVYTQS